MSPRHLLYLAPDGRARDAPDVTAERVLPAITSAGWDVHVASDGNRARALLGEHEFGVGMARLSPSSNDSNLEDTERLLRADAQLAWIALLAPEARNNDEVCRLVWESCYDYHTLPPDLDRLLTTLGHAYGMAMIARGAPEAAVTDEEEPQMVAVCDTMQAVFRNIRKIAAVDAPVLITGESGTGKELAAQAIYERSSRAGGPFVPINSATLPATLIQSELFGHEKGAFTGAQRRKIGSIESANRGTLFLDEIGDLSLDLQVNLLRFLQEGTIQRVGSPKEIPLDVRVIAATNTNLEKATRDGRFREDLYFRLNVLHLEMPPLRERDDDIEVLARFFFDKFRRETSRSVKGFSDGAFEAMREHLWPGNVRELINRVRRAIVMCEGRLIRPADLGLNARPRQLRLKTLDQVRSDAEKEAILLTLKASGNNLSQAARALGVSRPRLYRLMAKYGVSA